MYICWFEYAGLKQHVIGPTHRHGHTLDLLLTRTDENLISNLNILLSDHQPALCNIVILLAVTFRKVTARLKTLTL